MTQSNHTPGPWLFDEDHINVIIESGQTIAVRPDYSSLYSHSEEADMRLISAAPDLLDALETAMEWIKGWDVGFLFDDEWPADEAKICAAIAKAKGI